MSGVGGTLEFADVSTREIAKIVRSLEAISENYSLWFMGYSATKGGDICFTHMCWHQIFVPVSATERKQFFRALIIGENGNEWVYIKPEGGIFRHLKVTFAG